MFMMSSVKGRSVFTMPELIVNARIWFVSTGGIRHDKGKTCCNYLSQQRYRRSASIQRTVNSFTADYIETDYLNGNSH